MIAPTASRRLSLVFALVSFAVLPTAARAQTRPAPRVASGPGEVHGRLTESGTKAPVGSGSITVVRGKEATVVGAAFPKADGTFRIEGIAVGRYSVRIRSLGFAPITRDDVVVTAAQPSIDLGDVALSRVATQLGAVATTAEREDVQLAPDRNVYSTKNMATASGGTAIDVLRNVPSVEVDGSNNVSLRGNQNVVVQINGRSTPLKGDQLGNFLQQLPSSAIKNVEVATNPSAKNDPEGTAGIINIVLNQDAELSLSGGMNLAYGTNGQENASGNIGQQRGKFTWFTSYGLFTGHQTNSGWSQQTNLTIPTPATVNARITGSNKPLWQNGTLRTEYRFTPHDALSGDFMVSGGRFNGGNASYFSDYDDFGNVIGLFNQFSNGSSSNTMADYDFAYRRTGDPKTRTFSTEVELNQSSNRNTNDLFGSVLRGDASTGALVMPTELDHSRTTLPRVQFQADLTQPWSTGTKLETGFKEILRHTTSDFDASYLDDSTNAFVIDPARTTAFDYKEQIGAAYAVLSQRVKKVQAQAGVRLEQALTQLALPTAPADSQRFDDNYASLYPSGILSYDFTPMRTAKISYSRRVSRPYPQQLSPVEYRQDARTIFHGNPDLKPEYTDAYELTFQDTHRWGTLQLNPYLRRTNNAVRFIQTTDTSGITTGTFANLASSTQAGSDLNLSLHGGPFTVFTGGSLYHYSSDAANLSGNLSANATVWSARLSGTWKLTKQLDAQMFSNYRSAMRTEGGQTRAFTYMNFALRDKLWGDKGSITLRVTDPFNMMTFGSMTQNPEVIQSTVRNFGQRGIVIAFSRSFGQQLKLRPKQADDQPPSSGAPTAP